MPTKMRLQRRGKKGMPFYHIVIADGRAPRDGKYIEKIGTYNPLTIPAEIIINTDIAIDWLQKGAVPTDTCRAILSYKGILYKNHLLKGVKKGALTEIEAEAKYIAWSKEKEDKISGVKKQNLSEVDSKIRELQKQETKIKEDREQAIAKKNAKDVVEEQDAETPADDATDAPEVKAEAKEEIKEEAKAEVKEEVKAEVKEEAKAEVKEEAKAEVKEEVKAEVKEEAKAEVKEETTKE